MPSQEDIEAQQELLAAHRRTLAHLLTQQAQFSAGYIPAHVANGVQEARDNITWIKGGLREWGIKVEDLPNDIEQVSLALSPEENDANLLKKHREIFERHAFSMSCISELGLFELTQAFDHTILVINTGKLYTRDSRDYQDLFIGRPGIEP
jgi:hypothetical protein